MATMRVGLVSPERELWSGEATELYARTLIGEIGILPGHVPVLGVLAEGGVVKIVPAEGEIISVAVSGGFLSVNDNQVSILAESAEFADEIDVEAARAALAAADAGSSEAQQAQGRLDAAGASRV
jgi:F-type H+-transporting ATPase subunit epsilon